MGRQFAKGTKALFVCDRSGFSFPYREMVREPGTGLFVHYTESDGQYSRVNHPQNFPPRDLVDATALKWARPDRNEEAANDVYIVDEDRNPILFGGDMFGEFPVFAITSVKSYEG